MVYRALAVLALSGLATHSSQSPSCRPPSRTATRVDSTQVRELAGTYQLTTVNTAPGYDQAVSQSRLRLATVDTGHLYMTHQVIGAVRRIWRPLAGREEWTIGDKVYSDTAIVTARGLVIGCTNCLDGSPTSYTILTVTDSGFTGTWFNPETGLGYPVDKQGRRLPDPSGYFCAQRVKP